MWRYKSWGEVWSTAKRRPITAVLAALFFLLSFFGKFLLMLARINTVASASDSPAIRFILIHLQSLALVIAIVLLFFIVWPRPPRVNRERWLERGTSTFMFTSAGLDWWLDEHDDKGANAAVTLRIVATGEVPQPLSLLIIAVPPLRSAQPSFFPDEAQASASVKTQIEVLPIRHNRTRFRLVFPKLRGQARLDVRLTSVGNARIAIRKVLRRRI